MASPAQAATPVPTYTWSGTDADSGVNSSWSDGANWVGGLAPTTSGPVNLVFPNPTSCANGCPSNNNIAGLTVASFTTTNQNTTGGSVNLTGPLTINGNVSVVGLNLAEPTNPTWTLTDQDVTFEQVTGQPVTIMLAGGSQLTGDFGTSGLAVEGANPQAAPAANGTIEDQLGVVGAYFADVAMTWTVGSGDVGPFATSGDVLNLNTMSSTRFPVTQVIDVDGVAKFDAASTIDFDGAYVANSVPEGPEVWADPTLTEVGPGAIDLNGVNLALPGGCGNAAVTLVSSSPGVVGTFDQVVGGKEVSVPNNAIVTGAGGCYERINYTSTSVTVTPVDPPVVSMYPSSHSPSIPGQKVTFTAIASGTITGGTMSFASNGTPITGCTAEPVNTTTGQATCSAAFPAAGDYSITASYSGAADTPPGGPSSPITQVVVPAPTATITTTATSWEYLTGQQITGTASDVGGPGVQAVFVYYINTVTGASGKIVATCSGCGATETSVTWDVPITSTGPVPSGVYEFDAQAEDVNNNLGQVSPIHDAFVVN